jgi:hypothetical protein
MVAGQNQYLFVTFQVKMKKIAPNGIGGPLEPVSIVDRLLRSQYTHKCPGKIVEPVGIIDMIIQ